MVTAEYSHKAEVKYNQAAYQQERINELMRTINLCQISPTQFNLAYGEFNYRIIFNVLTTYYMEIRVKLKEERKKIDVVMHDLYSYMEANPIVSQGTKSSLYAREEVSSKFNTEAWSIIKRALFIYQNKILDAAESRGMGNPNKKDPSKAVIDL